MKSKWLISVGLVVCLVMAFCLPMCAPAPPAEEEELAPSVTAYMGYANTEFSDKIVAYIEEELGVKVNYTFHSFGEIGAMLEAEAPNFNVDMILGGGFAEALKAKKEGWIIPYASPVWQGETEHWRDPDNYWVVTSRSHLGWLYSKDLFEQAGYAPMPEKASYKVLLDPKWKGELAMPSPLTSGSGWSAFVGFMTIFGLDTAKGEEGGWEFLEALNKNIHHYTRSGSAPVELVSRGEIMMALATEVAIPWRIEEGYPIAYVAPEEAFFTHGVYVYILKGCTEEYTCQKIIDELWAHDFCELCAEWGSFSGRDPTVVPALLGEAAEGVPDVSIDQVWFQENRERLRAEWKERIGRVAE